MVPEEPSRDRRRLGPGLAMCFLGAVAGIAFSIFKARAKPWAAAIDAIALSGNGAAGAVLLFAIYRIISRGRGSN